MAAAARLMWQACRDEWNDGCQLLGLTDRLGTRPPGFMARLRFVARLAAAQSLRQCDAVFFSHLSLVRAECFVPPSARRRYAVFLHGIEAWGAISAPQRRMLEGARMLIANSEYTARRVSAAHPWIGPIATCPLGLPPGVAQAGDAQPKGASADAVVLIVARMDAAERYKGHDQLIDAWPAVTTRVRDARLVVVGDGDDLPRLRAKAAVLGLGSSVMFTGFVSETELASLYARSAVFAMPSRNEGFGLVYLEAMARGLPCIGSVHDAAGDIVEDGKTGFLVDQGDPQALVEMVVRLLSDVGLRRAMGAAGRARVERDFSYARFRSRFVALVDGALGDGA